MTEKVKAIKERIQEKETRSLWQKRIKDYALKCDYFISKSTLFADLYTNYQRTTNKLIKELKS